MTQQWLRSVLVVVEVALSAVLLTGSGLFLASFQVRPHEPWIFAAVAATGATGLSAAFLPSRRAARVDPLVVLRLE